MFSPYYLGIDVSKGYADFCLLSHDGQVLDEQVLDDTAAGHEQLRKLIKTFSAGPESPAFEVGLEATGGFERNWLKTLGQFGELAPIETFLVNPLAVKRFMQQDLHGNKTDRISARAIAQYMRQGLRRNEVPFEEHLEGAKAVVRMVRAMVRQAADLRNRIQMLMQRAQPELVQYCRSRFPKWLQSVLSSYPTASRLARATPTELAQIPFVTPQRARRLIAAAQGSVASQQDEDTAFAMKYMVERLCALEQEIEQLKGRVWEMMEHEGDVHILASIPGISQWAAVVLRIEIGPIVRFSSAEKLVAYVGVDPQIDQSGDRCRDKSISKRGNPRIRAMLYSCIRSAVQHNPPIRAFYKTLRGRGKHHMVSMVACMRKLVHIIYGCTLKGEPFDPEFEQRLKRRKKETGQVEPAGRPEGQLVDLRAPISRKEAQRRRETVSPQESISSGVRGQEASLEEP